MSLLVFGLLLLICVMVVVGIDVSTVVVVVVVVVDVNGVVAVVAVAGCGVVYFVIICVFDGVVYREFEHNVDFVVIRCVVMGVVVRDVVVVDGVGVLIATTRYLPVLRVSSCVLLLFFFVWTHQPTNVCSR